MSTWGSDGAEGSKPKNLTNEEKAKCTADKTGWTVPAGGNDNPAANRETLVAVSGMSETPAPPAEEEEEE